MNKVLLALLIITLFLTSGCLDTQITHVVIREDHPWEIASGRRMWHTLRYNVGKQVETLHLSVGVREVTLLLPLHYTHIFALYPLGSNSPLGGGLTPLRKEEKVYLSQREGALTDTLLRIVPTWSEIVSHLNYDKIVGDILTFPSSYKIDYRTLVKDLVEGNYDVSRYNYQNTYEASFDTLPSGRYVSDSPNCPSFYKSEYRTVVLDSLIPGVYNFYHVDLKMMCTLLVPDDKNTKPTYYMKALDTLFTITNSEYQKLLEGR
ncbi:MAG: hypothetical protein EOM67_08500 [Spirochaetia bacterium]|nr:hypothetical protein [Spirochaetia bacterium]